MVSSATSLPGITFATKLSVNSPGLQGNDEWYKMHCTLLNSACKLYWDLTCTCGGRPRPS